MWGQSCPPEPCSVHTRVDGQPCQAMSTLLLPCLLPFPLCCAVPYHTHTAEMTGLDVESDSIMQIAVICTGGQWQGLQGWGSCCLCGHLLLSPGGVRHTLPPCHTILPIPPDLPALPWPPPPPPAPSCRASEPWCVVQHGKSGLTQVGGWASGGAGGGGREGGKRACLGAAKRGLWLDHCVPLLLPTYGPGFGCAVRAGLPREQRQPVRRGAAGARVCAATCTGAEHRAGTTCD